jgi:membrane protease subunit (stomatin/prohibitin family)
MALIDLVRWAPQAGTDMFAWRFPETNLSTHTQLIVQESQEAILFSKGQIVGKFGPGKHTLSTENLPIIRHLYGIPFGGKNPFTAEVWFVNKLHPYNIPWSIDRMTIHDIDYNTQLPLTSSGQYGLRIADSEKFLVKVVGPKSGFTQRDLTEQFRGEFTTKVKSLILQYMHANNVGFKNISAFLDSISNHLRTSMNPFWDNLGLELTGFYVSTIEIDDSTPDGQRVKEAIAKQAAMSITGYSWQQEQMFETAQQAIGGFSNGMGGEGSGLINNLLALNMMNSMGGMANSGLGQSMMQPQYNQAPFGGNQAYGQQQQYPQSQQVKMVFCSNCAKKYPSTMQFCPNCGDPYNPCPKCGTDNDKGAKRCISCGSYLAEGSSSTCPNCNAPLVPGAMFCGNCGTKLANDNACRVCGTTLSPGVKFCPVCGNKR